MICPRCKKEYTGVPATSRIDSETEICSDCGSAEAMDEYFGESMSKFTYTIEVTYGSGHQRRVGMKLVDMCIEALKICMETNHRKNKVSFKVKNESK